MDIIYAKSLHLKYLRNIYRKHLETVYTNRNTIDTTLTDTFYLWKHSGNEEFWSIIYSEDFDSTAKSALANALKNNSKGNTTSLIQGYFNKLKDFRNFILNFDCGNLESDLNALKDFLLDIECLEPISSRADKFNIFDILKITRTEIRHSNVLAWLINPSENHNLGDSIIKGIIRNISLSFENNEEVFNALLIDGYDFTVQREWRNIDILAVSENNKMVICIENKIDSTEHNNQLNNYRAIIENTYADFRKIFIYLSPYGNQASDPDNWYAMSYQNILDIIVNAKDKKKLQPDVELLIENYLEAIRRDILKDEKLAQICKEIYYKHQRALDLIFENKPDRASELADIIQLWAKQKSKEGEIDFNPENSSKCYVRFKTKNMSYLLPDYPSAKSAWKTNNFYFYEINNIDGKEFYITLALNSTNIPDELRAVCNKINSVFPSRPNKVNWVYRYPFTTNSSKTNDELTEEKIFKQLNDKFDKVKIFEKELLDKLKS